MLSGEKHYLANGVGGSVMVWAAITSEHTSALVFVDGTLNSRDYINNSLQLVAIYTT